MAKPPRDKDVETLKHTDRRVNTPTAEMAPVYEQQAELSRTRFKDLRLQRAHPLAEGEARVRDTDLDPQIVWNGATISLTPEQIAQLTATGTVEIGDAQLVWRGKDTQDWSDLVVNAPPLYIQEKVHPKAIIDDLKRRTAARRAETSEAPDLFADFNGLNDPEDRYEFYRHSMHWQNRFILGDSLQVMASLAQREGMKGKVQAIYFDPPYGIKFNSNWQVSTLSRDVKDGKAADITREPEQVKAFRDTWKDGIHSYLTYLRDRLTVARELLTESGSIFVQIGDENVHRVRAVMDEVFGAENLISEILVKKKGAQKGSFIDPVNDYLLWYGRNSKSSGKVKYRPAFESRAIDSETVDEFSRVELPNGTIINLKDFLGADGEKRDFRLAPKSVFEEFPEGRLLRAWPITNGGHRENQMAPVEFDGRSFSPPKGRCWSHTSKPNTSGLTGMQRVAASGRLMGSGTSLDFRRYLDDFPFKTISNWWDGFGGASDQVYVVQTNERLIQRCLLMATDPGDLVLDPTCGSGTTATVAEQWGRRWITIDTSRVALALARTRLMSARYPYYLLADSTDGRAQEGKLSGRLPLSDPPPLGDIKQGFVYRRATYITSGIIANNAEIDIIYERFQEVLEPLRAQMNALVFGANPSSGADAPPSPLRGEGKGGDDTGTAPTSPLRGEVGAQSAPGEGWQEWQIPRDLDVWLDTKEGKAWLSSPRPFGERSDRDSDPGKGALSPQLRALHAAWWQNRIARQQEIDASIARAADVELLYDRPYEDKTKVRVAGPFTVESLSPHRVVTSRDDSLGPALAGAEGTLQPNPANEPEADFGRMVLDNLRTSGVHQKDRADTIRFASLEPWPGRFVAAEGRYADGAGAEQRAAILIGPEFGTLTQGQINAAAREASAAGFAVLIACAFNFEALTTELDRMGALRIVKARMNPDLHMAEDLKNTGKGNLFVVFGEPDITLLRPADGQVQIKVNGVDVFDPSTGDIRSDGKDGIACWFIDTDYNEESFFVRHAYFLGSAQNGEGPYKSLKTALRAEIDEEAWASLYSDVSRPFPVPPGRRIAVKVINHFGDEVLKVFGV